MSVGAYSLECGANGYRGNKRQPSRVPVWTGNPSLVFNSSGQESVVVRLLARVNKAIGSMEGGAEVGEIGCPHAAEMRT